jgi:6-phosphogluconolactonase
MAAELLEVFRQLNHQTPGKNLSVALSGGSTPIRIFEEILKLPIADLPFRDFHYFWGDERCVPPNHPESNYRNARETFLRHLNIKEKNIYRIHGEADPRMEALRYAEILKMLPVHDNLPVFDLMLLGVGEDGHTASIFPNHMELLDAEETVAYTFHPVTGQPRITLTGRVINNARHVLFLCSGKSKAEIVTTILNHPPTNSPFPASFINPSKGKLSWFLDREAAEKL